MNYSLGNMIGKGSDGEVYELINKEGIRDKVIKFIQPTFCGIRNYLEPYILLHLKHDNIMSADIIEIEEDGLLKIVQNKADSDLNKKIKARRLNKIKKLKYMRQLTEAIYFLQSHSIIHGDIKPHNILLLNDNIKLSDFSLSRIILKEPTICYQKPYTISYRAPEIKENQIFLKSDIWALGCTLYEIYYGLKYFSISKEFKIYHVDDSNEENTFNNLIISMVDPDLTKRIDIEKVINFFHIEKKLYKSFLKPSIKFDNNNIHAKYLQKCYYDDKNTKMSNKYKKIEQKLATEYKFDIYQNTKEVEC